MSEGQHAVDEAAGIETAEEVRVAVDTNCGKCGDEVSDKSVGHTKALEITYQDLPDDWDDDVAEEVSTSVLCDDCAEGLRKRVDHRVRGTFDAHLHSEPNS